MYEPQPILRFPIHKAFELNKQKLDSDGLKEIAYTFIKEGEPYEQDIGYFLLEWLDSKSFIIVKTSGSTGKPKTIKVLKEQMVNSAKATGEFFKLDSETTALLCLSATYIAGKMMLVRAMVLGWKLDCVPPKSNPLDTVYKQYDFCAMVPLQLDNSINRLHLINKLIVGGGVISENLKSLVQASKTKIFETYGMTETVSHIAARRVNAKKRERKKNIYFKTLPNISIAIDERNCLVINAPLLHDKQLITNDVVELKSYKKFDWKGRYDNVINSGGIKLFPEAIEAKLQLLITHRFFVASLPDAVLGEQLILIIESAPSETLVSSIKEGIANISTLSRYEVPKQIFCIPQFVETDTGKIQRAKTVALR
ncbi:AMP-binding protein [Aquimarina sp. 2-A2]|uniref:AMP-binding protein n=1 Tax=Aquimarina sp. 2-A2 TaxID=3382644 RepID=UPI00387F2C08